MRDAVRKRTNVSSSTFGGYRANPLASSSADRLPEATEVAVKVPIYRESSTAGGWDLRRGPFDAQQS